jgi:hypothetical protein
VIGYFPAPLPDEALFSVCARYQTRTSLPTPTVLMQLFGSLNGGTSIRFPNRISFLASQLSWTGIYSEEQIIQNHTLFPVYKPFLSKKRRVTVIRTMLGNQRKNVHAQVGYREINFGRGKVLWFCPLCSLEDKERYGTYYWHRLHQISEVFICPIHSIMLEMAPIAAQEKPFDGTSFFHDANNVIPVLLPKIYEGPMSQYFQMITKDFLWLLTAAQSNWDREVIAVAYQTLMRESISSRKQLRVDVVKELTDKLQEVFPKSFLSFFGIDLAKADHRHNWLMSLVTNPKVTLPPIRHIVVIHSLGFNISEFYQHVVSVKKATGM